MTTGGRALVLFLGLILGAPGRAAPGDDALRLPKGEIPEDRLLDVAIDLFSPGVNEGDPSPLLKKGIRASVRKSEARYIPIHLRNTLQSSGQWGAVRVVPGGALWAEILVTGTIDKSNGKKLEVRVTARDAPGRVWLEKDYERGGRHRRLRQGPAGGRPGPLPGAVQPDRQRPRPRPRQAEAQGARRGARGGPPALRGEHGPRPLRGLRDDGREGPQPCRTAARGRRSDARSASARSGTATRCSWTR